MEVPKVILVTRHHIVPIKLQFLFDFAALHLVLYQKHAVLLELRKADIVTKGSLLLFLIPNLPKCFYFLRNLLAIVVGF